MPKLRLHSPASIPGLGSLIGIPGDDVTVGRGPDNAVIIPESTISLHHARLQRKPGGWILTDLGNTNGIWVGVKRVTELELRRGQLFRIGGVALEFLDDATESSALDNVAAPQQVAAIAMPVHDSGIREPQPWDAKDQTLADAPLRLSLPLNSMRDRKQIPAPQTTPVAPTHFGIQRILAGILAMIVLGFAVTLGGHFALKWMSQSRHGPRAIPTMATPNVMARPGATAIAPAPQALLADKSIDNVAEEQRIDVPDLISLTLPSNALHATTHLVVARSVKQGTPFCNATEFAGPVFEIETAYNRVWAHPGTVEIAVDAEQLAKSRVAAVAIGLFDQTKQVWQLLPTEYDPNSRRAKAQLWQPGLLALFFVAGPENVASSEHFELLIEPSAGNVAKPVRDRSKALSQLELALSQYRQAGYRVPSGRLWVCAASSTIHRSMALLPVVSRAELSKAHNLSLARAAFATLTPAYLNSRSVDGREFWFDAMFHAVALQTIGLRVTGSNSSTKRLQNSLVAEDWPSAPLYLNLVSRTLDQHVDLFRIWTETTHVINELDTKAGAEGQSPVLPIELALQQETQKSLLDQYVDFVTERLFAAAGAGSNANSAERCPALTSIPAATKSGAIQLDLPGHYTARWACLELDVPAGRYRSIRLNLAADPSPGMNLRLLRPSSGQILDAALSSTRNVRLDVLGSETFVIVGVNSNMAQNAVVTLRYDDVTIGAAIEGPASIAVRPGQNVSSSLQLTGIFPELKNIDLEWDYSDDTPKERSNLAANGTVRVERSHVWIKPGNFTLRVSVFDPAKPKQEIGFATRQISVQPVQLEFTVLDTNPQAQSEVRFLVKATGPLPEAPQFRISFGDNSEPVISATPSVSHRYASAGEYAVTAELISASTPTDVVGSSKIALTVRTADSPATVTSAPSQPVVAPATASSASVQ